MKRIGILLLLFALTLSFCEKDESTENWAAGDNWIDTRDGQSYATIQIGEQVWMAENLAYLPKLIHPSNTSMTDPYYYVYGYEGTSVIEAQATDNYKTYGVLYNWPAAKKACPAGWHLPTDDEWKVLEKFLGMNQTVADSVGRRGTNEGGKLKEIGLAHWSEPNTGATNESGFTALPGGLFCGGINYFCSMGWLSNFWSSTVDGQSAWHRKLSCVNSKVERSMSYYDKGISVRCVKDE